jgi:methionyl-tRNA formyltransferase
LGNLYKVAACLQRHPQVRLAVWLIESGDRSDTDIRRVGRICDIPVVPVRDSADVAAALSEVAPVDAGVIANFGIILRADALSVPRGGFVNAHFGLLPENPGRNPVRRILDEGGAVTGVSLHRVIEKVDAGPILATRTVSVGARRDPIELFERLSDAAALLIEAHFSRRPE